MSETAPTFAADLLVGKNAFITGGTSGINLGIAKVFAQAGASVAILGRKEDKAKAAASELAEYAHASSEVMSVCADVRDYEGLEAAIANAHDSLGELDVLVCGAAGNFPAPVAAMSANGFKAVVDIDLNGTFNASRAAFNFLRKPGASVINISAPQAFMPTPLQAHVCAAKSGVDMFTRVLAMEWGQLGIRVNSLTPGPVDDTEGMARLAPTEEARERTKKSVPLGRFASAEELGHVALFLCSPAAAYIHGSVVVADGGWSLGGASGFGL
ncbi:MAG: SDR family oxidoreductase [Myxococcota bacterium]